VAYAHKLAALAHRVQDKIYIVMRTYFDKPRTSLGWRGFILDPHLDGSFDTQQGLRWARQCLRAILDLGLPTAAEVVDGIAASYIQDALCWAGIGARTVESPVHRQLASGLPMPVGFKNAMDGHVMAAIHAILVAQQPQTFLGLDDQGQLALLQSAGNACVHLVLRGGRQQGNADALSVACALEQLAQAGLPASVLIDCAHGNSGKVARGQIPVFEQALAQMQHNRSVLGLMLESHLSEGRQALPTQPASEPLRYGVSISDPCLGWDHTQELILRWHRQLRAS
jgi:3-deoxy-7-phosphoheptulonate synthase